LNLSDNLKNWGGDIVSAKRVLWIAILLISFSMLASQALQLWSSFAFSSAQGRTEARDVAALTALENEWLNGQNNGALLERILADDFLHPVPSGDLLSKREHIQYVVKRSTPAGRKLKFDNLHIRIYGDVGIVNGVVVANDESGKEVSRSIFTDVFVFRQGQWRAVSAQENLVETGTKTN
jgi:hypothetical protein